MFWLVFSWLISRFSRSSKIADGPNLLDMAKSATNAFKKREIVKKIMELKDKVVVGEEIRSLWTHMLLKNIYHLYWDWTKDHCNNLAVSPFLLPLIMPWAFTFVPVGTILGVSEVLQILLRILLFIRILSKKFS